jgi:flavin reductase (DIM6/NTAB) family NADH-FMN oxidoreductase RutF
MIKRAYPQAKVHRLLESGPVVMITTEHKGRPNVMTMSWHTMMDFEPPLVGFIMSDRNFSFAALQATRECVINIPTAELAKAAVGCGNVSGRRVDKFARFGLTPLPAARVTPPLVGECYANLECRVVDTRLVAKYGFFVLEVLKAWVDPFQKEPRTLHHRGGSEFMVAGRTLKVASRKA